MSTVYWTCEGVGIRTNELYPFLNKQKCIETIRKQVPDKEIEEDDFDIDEYFFGEVFDNLGDMLCHVDDTNTLTYGDNNEGEYYFYYPPSYPWDRRENEPESIEEVHERIIAAVLQLCDMDRQEIEAIIDDSIYDYGCG